MKKIMQIFALMLVVLLVAGCYGNQPLPPKPIIIEEPGEPGTPVEDPDPDAPINEELFTKQDVLDMLNNCHVDSMLTTSDVDLNGNLHCGNSYICTEVYFSYVSNPEDLAFSLENTIRVSCSDSYNGPTESYYIQSVCCSS